MKAEIQGVMTKRDPVAVSNLQLGDLILIKNYKGGAMDLKATGPCIFLEYQSSHKTSGIVYNTNTKRIHRVKTAHMAPIQSV